MDTKWVKDSFDKGKHEILKFAKASKVRIDITSLKKKKEERIKLLGSKALEMVERGELNAEVFEPDYTYIKNIDNEIEEKEELLSAVEEEELAETEETTEESDDIDIVQIESQKVLTADSIPLEPEEEDKQK